MKSIRNTIMDNGAIRLKEIRAQLNYTPEMMAAKLDVGRPTYYKYEKSKSFLGLEPLNRLHKNLRISMNWFLFGSGPMKYTEQEETPQPGKTLETKRHIIEEIMPEVKEMLDQMTQNPVLRHEIMAYYYAAKEKKETPPNEEHPITG
jgi:transcriptional regulator with XRE-family HTH domain